jgi:hypothetical protein
MGRLFRCARGSHINRQSGSHPGIPVKRHLGRAEMRRYILLSLLTTIYFPSAAVSWEATRDGGLVRLPEALNTVKENLISGKIEILAPAVVGLTEADLSNPFGPRILAYPHDEGVVLGQGWDFISNRKKQASCISAGPVKPIANTAIGSLKGSHRRQVIQMPIKKLL